VIITVPALTAERTPPELIVAIDALLVDQVADIGSVYVAVVPAHNESGPVIMPVPGTEMTETDVVAETEPQELVTVYEIVAVPLETPYTTPDALTVTIDVLLLDHVPPEAPVESASVIVAPAQTVDGPVIAPADAPEETVITLVAVAVPQLLVTV
jgi:hypothetical protein